MTYRKLLLGLAVLSSSSTAHAASDFGSAEDSATGASPIRLAVADLNRDGKPDVMVPNRGSDSVGIFLGDGRGNLSPTAVSPAVSAPQTITTGDFDRNGTLDLAVGTQTGHVHVLLGDGRGAFRTASGSPMPMLDATGNKAYGIATGDVNHDGALDIAATAYGAARVVIFLGHGDGTFAAGPALVTGAAPMGLVMADLDGDGNLDLAASATGAGNTPANDVTVFLGAGDGTFRTAPQSPFPVHNGPGGLAVADFNEDGKVDLAISHEGAMEVLISLGGEDGTFTNSTALPTGTLTFSVTTADFNADGHADIATADYGASQTHVFYGDGKGAFAGAPGSPYAVGDGPGGVVAADMNLDGAPDLVLANTRASTVSVLLNQVPRTAVDAGPRPTDAGVDASLGWHDAGELSVEPTHEGSSIGAAEHRLPTVAGPAREVFTAEGGCATASARDRANAAALGLVLLAIVAGARRRRSR